MRNVASTTFVVTLGISIAVGSPALAMDPVCQSLMNAEKNLAKTPFHIYLTTQNGFQSSTLAKAGAQLGITGTKKSEEIFNGKDVYVEHDGKWIDTQTNFMQMPNPDDPNVKKERETARCHTLPDTMVAGQPASGYEEINSDTGIDSKIWVSKISHMPLKSEMTTDTGEMKSFVSSTYDYRNVQTPSGAMTMQQMVNSQHH